MRVLLLGLLTILAIAGAAAAQDISGRGCPLPVACVTPNGATLSLASASTGSGMDVTLSPITPAAGGSPSYGVTYLSSVNYPGAISNPITYLLKSNLTITGAGTVTSGDNLAIYGGISYNHTGSIDNSNVIEAASTFGAAGTTNNAHGFFSNLANPGGATIGEFSVFTGGVTANTGTIGIYNTLRCTGAGGFLGNAPGFIACVRNLDAAAVIYTAGRIGIGIADQVQPGAMLDISASASFNALRLLDGDLSGTKGWAWGMTTNGSNSDMHLFEYGPNKDEYIYQSGGGYSMNKRTASGVAPGASLMKFEVAAGTTGGTCKLIAYAGTSTTPTTIIDNVGSGC